MQETDGKYALISHVMIRI